MNYFYTFEKGEETITVSGTGEDPHNIKNIVWTSSPGAEGVLKQMDDIKSVYTPTVGFVSIDNYKNDMYVQITKFGSIYKNGWRFQNTNLPVTDVDVTKSEMLEKGKTKKRVYVKGTGKRAAYWRVQEVGREEIDPKKIENLWDIPLSQFSRLVSGDKTLLKERYIQEHKYKDYDDHPKLQALLDMCNESIQDNSDANLRFFDDPDLNVHTKSIYQAIGAGVDVPLAVLKDYPDLSRDAQIIDLSEAAIQRDTEARKDIPITNLYQVTKEEYDGVIDEVKIDYDTNPEHVTDKILKLDYEEELADCKRSAKLRKKIFDNIPEGYKADFTPETMNEALYGNLLRYAIHNKRDITDEVKAEFPIYFPDTPFRYTSTGDTKCDNAANSILTEIRSQCGNNLSTLPNAINAVINPTDRRTPVEYADTMSVIEKALAESAMDDVSKLIGPELMKKIEGEVPVKIVQEPDKDRSWQIEGELHLSKGVIDDQASRYGINTISHEYGHAIEHMLPEIKKLSLKFVRGRTEGEPLVQLKKVCPFSGYDEWEKTRIDNFMDSYIGKDYLDNATEVLSMGMGYLTSRASMLKMYKEDPEYLGYILAVLSGRAHGASEPTNKSETIEIDLYKLLNTAGLTRKRVLVRKKGGAPFWSTRWVQEGDTVKDTVEAAGFELVAEEGEEPVDIKTLVKEAVAAGKAAFEAGITMRDTTDPARDAIIKRSDGSVTQELDIRDAWNKGWHAANVAAPVPGVTDGPPPEDKGIVDSESIKPSYEAGKAAFKRGIKSSDADFGLIPIIEGSNGTVATLDMIKLAWKRGWNEEAKKAPKPEPKPEKVTLKYLMGESLEAGKAAFGAGIPHDEIMSDPKMVDLVGQSDNLMHQLKIRENWSKGWSQAKKAADNFDTMPDVETEPDVKTTSIPIAERVSGTRVIGGWDGEVPAVKVSDLQVGDVQLFTNGVALKIKEIRRSGKSYIITHEGYIDKRTGTHWELKKQGRAMVGVMVPGVNAPDNFDTMPDPEPKPEPKQLTVEDVMPSIYEAGRNAFKNDISVDRSTDDPKTMEILMSVNHLAHDEKLKVLQRWVEGWEAALSDSVADFESKPEVEHPFGGANLADRVDPKTYMTVPGIYGKLPAIKVGNVQIGDRLQFVEGVFRVKDIVVKGASSTMVFEATDDKGKNLQLKKQNRAWMAAEKSQLSPGGYVPHSTPNDPGVPHWARSESEFEQEPLVSSTLGFTPAKTAAEGISRLRGFIDPGTDTSNLFHKYGIDLDGLKTSSINSIIKGFDKVLDKHDIKLDYIGWNPRKKKAMAYYVTYSDGHTGIEFQKTGTKNVKSRQKKSIKNFVINKETNIANHERNLTYPEMRLGDHERTKHNIKLLEACTRWTVDVSLDDMLAGTAAHEASHVVYFKHNLEAAWKRNLTYLVGDKMHRELKCASVSEYGMSSVKELFAEVGAAVAFDIPIDPDVKQAYLDTIGSIK